MQLSRYEFSVCRSHIISKNACSFKCPAISFISSKPPYKYLRCGAKMKDEDENNKISESKLVETLNDRLFISSHNASWLAQTNE